MANLNLIQQRVQQHIDRGIEREAEALYQAKMPDGLRPLRKLMYEAHESGDKATEDLISAIVSGLDYILEAVSHA